MKKRSIKHLALGKVSVSTLETNNINGGSPTTDQSQYCPVNPYPIPKEPVSVRPKICV